MGQRDVAGVATGSPGDAQAVEMRDPRRGLVLSGLGRRWSGGGPGRWAAAGPGRRGRQAPRGRFSDLTQPVTVTADTRDRRRAPWPSYTDFPPL